MTVVRCVVVDDHALFRAGLISLLNEMQDIIIVGEAGDGQEAINILKDTKPDLMLIDVNMPVMSGVDTVKEVRSMPKSDQCHIIMLTISKNDEDLLGAIAAGADGYLLKDAEPDELHDSIILVQQGMSVLSPQITRNVLNAVAAEPNLLPEINLSRREMEVLERLSEGNTTIQIANQLYISENTVKTHVRHILEKLNASNRVEAVNKANRLGILKQD
jgi:DNA-binding NarL/FixJ family response regulator